MYVKLSEDEIALIVKDYLFEDETIRNSEGFFLKLKIEYHEGTYDMDSYHSLNAGYVYLERNNVFGKEIINKKYVKINYEQLEEILNAVLEREGKRIKSSYYYHNAIGFDIEKLDQIKLTKEMKNENNRNEKWK